MLTWTGCIRRIIIWEENAVDAIPFLSLFRLACCSHSSSEFSVLLDSNALINRVQSPFAGDVNLGMAEELRVPVKVPATPWTLRFTHMVAIQMVPAECQLLRKITVELALHVLFQSVHRRPAMSSTRNFSCIFTWATFEERASQERFRYWAFAISEGSWALLVLITVLLFVAIKVCRLIFTMEFTGPGSFPFP